MDPNKLTQKSQEALAQAQSIAVGYGQTEVDGEHLLLALLRQPDGLIPRLVDRMDVPLDSLTAAVEREIARRPRVSGPGLDPNRIAISVKLGQVLAAAEERARRLKDEYVSVEHLFLAILEEGANTPAGRILRQANITPDRFLEALRGATAHRPGLFTLDVA